METFCSEPLQIDDFSIHFLPDFRKKTRRYYDFTYISFLNVLSKAEEEAMTDYVKQFAIVIGNPRYPVKVVKGVQYMTGTPIYRVHSLNKHIPRIINLFGQQIKCIYTSQPEYQEQLEKRKQQREQTHNDNDSDTTSNTSETLTHTLLDNETNTQSQDDNTENQNENVENQMNNQPENDNDHIENLNNTQIIINQINNQSDDNIQTENEPQQNTKSETENMQEQITKNKTKRQANQHLPNKSNNVTQRKRKNNNNNNNNKTQEEIQVDNLPPQFTNQNYPPLQQNIPKNQNTQQTQEQQHEITVIEETPQNEQP